jgi:hypothetical protein
LPAIRVLGPDTVSLVERSPQPPKELSRAVATTSVRTDDTVPTLVRLTAEAHRELSEVRFDSSNEHGGYLFGVVRGPELVVEALRAGKGSGTQGEPHSVGMDKEWALMWEEQFERHGWRVCGLWHSHPRTPPHEPLELSDHDEDSIARWAQAGRETIVSLLLAPADPDKYHNVWAFPRMAAWLSHADGSVREAALLLEEANI